MAHVGWEVALKVADGGNGVGGGGGKVVSDQVSGRMLTSIQETKEKSCQNSSNWQIVSNWALAKPCRPRTTWPIAK